MSDESIHGAYVGLLAQEIYAKQTDEMKTDLREWAMSSLNDLYENELEYTRDLYGRIGLNADVKAFVEYNANKAMANLGFEPYFESARVNQVILNGLSTKTKSHDFFSAKGNSYKKAVVEPVQDSDFIFE